MTASRLARRNYVAYIYLLPWILGILVFTIYPFMASAYYSVTDYQLLRGLSEANFVGLRNYIRLFTEDPYFLKSMWVTLKFVLFTVPPKLIFSLIIAMMLCRGRRGINSLRTLYYLPSLFGGSVAVVIMWRTMVGNPGLVNNLLGLINVAPVEFLGNPATALPTISMLEVWQFGSSMVLYLAALKQVPASQYEAACIDGAGAAQRFFKITIPHISPVIFFTIIMQTLNALQNFTAAFVLTDGKGTPVQETFLLSLKLYQEAFAYGKMGYASAVAWIIFIIMALFTLILFATQRFWVFYGDES